jgi:acylphosphatase
LSDRRSVHVVIRGRVQGVGFRAWTHHQAELHGVAGWVRNRRDGTVEAVFAGPASAVEQLVAVCRDGPRGSAVAEVVASDADDAAIAPGSGFEVRRTA